MGIRSLIQREKDRFYAAKKQRIMTETAKLEAAREKEGELAKLNAKKQVAARDYAKIKEYNQQVQGPNKLQKFAKGLEKTMKGAQKASKSLQKARKALPKGKGMFQPSGNNPFAMNTGPFYDTPKRKKK